MAKFVVTSDWHIGARMGTAGRAADRFREIRFETAARVVQLAEEEDAVALFLLGDTFDGDRVGWEDVDRTRKVLAKASCPVYVLPGNHDWWHRGGVLPSFARAVEDVENIEVLSEVGATLRLPGAPGVTFYPCPVLKRADVADPTRWIPAREASDGVRIALIHGAFDRAEWGGHVPERVAEVRDLDLAVLGDWHKPVDGPDGRTFYPGSLEAGGFDESHRGQVLVATVDGAEVATDRVPVGRLAWRRIERELTAAELGGQGPSVVQTAIEEIEGDRDVTAVRLRLSGSLSPAELDRLDEVLADGRDAGFAEFDVHVDVIPVGDPDLDAFEDEAVRAVAGRVWESDEEPAVRRRALAMLAKLSEDVR